MGKYVIYIEDVYGNRYFQDEKNKAGRFFYNEFVIYNTLEEAKNVLERSGSNKEFIMDLEEMKKESFNAMLHKVPALQSIERYLKSDDLYVLYKESGYEYIVLDRKNAAAFFFNLEDKCLDAVDNRFFEVEEGQLSYQKNSALYNMIVELFKTLDGQGWKSKDEDMPIDSWLDWEEQ